MIRATSSGSFDKTTAYLERLKAKKMFDNLERFGRVGVQALSGATPRETSETANSWDYEIVRKKDKVTIHWKNTHEDNGVNIAVIIQYGHGTGTGGFVQGRDYINPAMRPVFDQILNDVWRQVTNV
jgi:hypothetical protein